MGVTCKDALRRPRRPGGEADGNWIPRHHLHSRVAIGRLHQIRKCGDDRTAADGTWSSGRGGCKDDVSELWQTAGDGIEAIQQGWIDYNVCGVRLGELIAKNISLRSEERRVGKECR